MNKLLAFFLIFQLSLFASWKTLKSEHFKVHYEENNEYIAIKTMQYLLQINDYLTYYLDYRPKMTNVVISDTLDDANGFARVIPYNLIHVYPYPPEADSVLGYYDDWLYILILHEYLHIVHIDKKGEIPKLLNKIFGKVFAPNQVLPKFITEGLAVFWESVITQRGRINSPYYKAIFRLSILNNDISLSELSNITHKYPYAGMVYLYGAFFIDYIFRYDDKFRAMAKFTKNYGENIIPYGINRALKQANGKTFTDEYENFKKYYLQKYKKMFWDIKKEKITPYIKIHAGEKYFLPVCNNLKTRDKNISDIVLDNDKLYFLSSFPENIPYLYYYDLKKKEIKKLIKFTQSSSDFDIIDKNIFYVSYFQNKNRMEKRFAVFNIESKISKILINDLRVVNFKINKNNFDVVLIVNENGIENFYLYNLKNKKLKRLTKFSKLTTLDNINFIDDENIVFSVNKDKKVWNIAKINIVNKEFEYITFDDYFDISPAYIDGKLYFISDRYKNILNLYEYDLDKNSVKRKTNFFNGIIKFVYNKNNNKFYALNFADKGGFEVIEFDKSSLINEDDTEKDKEIVFWENFKLKNNFKKEEFSVFPEILPKNIIPQISAGNFQNSIGVEISNNDVREYYFYSLYLDYFFDVNDILATLYFSDYSNYFYYSLGYSYTPFISDFMEVNGKTEQFRGQYHSFTVSFSLPFYDYDKNSQIYFSVTDRYLSLPKFKYEYKPWDKPPKLPKESDKFIYSLGYSYNNSISEIDIPGMGEGERFNIRLSFRDKELFADFNSVNFSVFYKNYYPLEIISSAFAFRYYFSMNFSEIGISKQYLGGFPDYGSIADKMIDRTSVSGIYLRGYPESYFITSNINFLSFEYRQHLFYTDAGYSTLPFYIYKLYLRLYWDIANISEDLYDFNLKHGIGAEITTRFYIGYFQPYSLSFGISKGLNEGGINHFYMEFTSLF